MKGWATTVPTGNPATVLGLNISDLGAGASSKADAIAIPADTMLSQAEMEALFTFLAAGGGVIFAGDLVGTNGWSPQEMVENLPANKLLTRFGIAFTGVAAPCLITNSGDPSDFYTFTASSLNSIPWAPRVSADGAAALITAHINGTRPNAAAATDGARRALGMRTAVGVGTESTALHADVKLVSMVTGACRHGCAALTSLPPLLTFPLSRVDAAQKRSTSAAAVRQQCAGFSGVARSLVGPQLVTGGGRA